MILMLDNYDSFTYNLVQYLGELEAEVHVVRNDQVTVEDIEQLAPAGIVVSPGPCSPDEAGVSIELIQRLAHRLPIFGVCLGHQALGQAYGGQVTRARQVMHGKTSTIRHTGRGVFENLADPLTATRYHSLIVARDGLPDDFEITAWTETDDGEMDEIMGLIHTPTGAEGVQFHPESILSEHGHEMLRTFLKRCGEGRPAEENEA
ncbi:aminodeoxychorismate/anthranilate synthase component II [Endozoicomonas sp. G2_2]|uniref:anthranilate synthase component II n=1 Tax=Gammaproteobacteria TaxID=1236 RepID=UPI000C676D3D|nr:MULTISPECIES: aminodeoxychorismate/anthranilate synthase component II [Gammaproteobacteria]MAS10556.1 anthranilate/aminodeoxychorismate synthase component II [Salinisphaera sp.]MBO9468642.1 aminodeoxychorismate/anthranilate synthase component II [Endozoicomonas sp. G2_2]|tara:strand:- start:738 stop:1352 length:615 start_codon:yes stop_codon:yes gene_type:complete